MIDTASDHATPVCACPACGHKLDAGLNTKDGAAPTPGNISICMYCGSANLFNDDLTIKPFTDQEWINLPLDVRKNIQRHQEVVTEYLHAKKAKTA